MNENHWQPDQEEFPDEASPEYAGCYMYAFYKLGLDPVEAQMGVTQDINKYLSRVLGVEDADALVIRDKNHGGIVHMVFIDRNHGGRMKHRENLGLPIEETTLDVLKLVYKAEKYEYIFLKKSENSDKNILKKIFQRLNRNR